MRILVLNHEFPPLGGGAAPVTRDLVREFVASGHVVDVVTMGFKGLPSREVVHGATVVRVPAVRARQATCEIHEMASYVASAALFLPRLIRRFRYHVVHCHFAIPTAPLATMVKLLGRLPYVITSHGSDIPGYNADRFTLAHRFTRPLLRFVFSQAECVTCPSEHLKSLIHRAASDTRVQVIPNGIDVSLFRPRRKKKSILMTGRLLPRKGFQHVLMALAGIETDFTVHIAGDGPLGPELRKLAEQLKTKVVFHGWLPHGSKVWRDLYETSMIYCMPSSSESFGLVLLEGMLSGSAVLTSNVSACPETVGSCGETVTPGDVPGIRRILSAWLRNPALAQEMGLRARERAVRHYDRRSIASAYLQLLEQACGSQSVGAQPDAAKPQDLTERLH